MNDAAIVPPEVRVFTPAGAARGATPRTLAAAFVLALGASAGVWVLGGAPAGPTGTVAASVALPAKPSPVAMRKRSAAAYTGLFDPSPLGMVPLPLDASGPLAAEFEWQPAALPTAVAVADTRPAPGPLADAAPDADDAPAVAAEVPMPIPAPAPPHFAEIVPLPMPRPPELRAVASQAPVRATPRQQLAQQGRRAAAPAAVADNRSFFEKVFGLGDRPAGPALAYAAPEDGQFDSARRLTASPPFADARRTAVYDIAAHTVFLPNGTRLEAHSGLGPMLDDPRSVAERNRGATPPHVYDLTLRESLFHGVQAIRLNPVGGGGVFGRVGLLAHTFMLGPNGDSNGCVSFRDYNAFLQAFRNGEINRLAVVARS